jgi:hypothetical protein
MKEEEEINKRIAELCGWTACRLVVKVVLSTLRDPVAYGIPPNGTYEIACLNYCTDLNAMHEAERSLHEPLREMYVRELLAKVADSPTSLWDVLTAHPRSRAEAFLRTLGKWEALEN